MVLDPLRPFIGLLKPLSNAPPHQCLVIAEHVFLLFTWRPKTSDTIRAPSIDAKYTDRIGSILSDRYCRRFNRRSDTNIIKINQVRLQLEDKDDEALI